jgi:hypothetical protein
MVPAGRYLLVWMGGKPAGGSVGRLKQLKRLRLSAVLGFRFRFFRHPPKLETFRLDRLFEVVPGHVVRGRAGGSDDAGHGPRPVISRKPAPGRIRGKRAQSAPRLRLEYVHAHGRDLSLLSTDFIHPPR